MLGIVYGALIKEVGCRRNKDKKKEKSMMMEKNQRGGRSNLGISIPKLKKQCMEPEKEK